MPPTTGRPTNGNNTTNVGSDAVPQPQISSLGGLAGGPKQAEKQLIDVRFDDFIKSGLYLKNWSPKTVRTYRQAWGSFSSFQQSQREDPGTSHQNGDAPAFSKAQLEAWIVSLRQRGLSPGGVNMYIRTMNSFCSWLHEEEHTSEHLRLKLLKNPAKPLRGFSEGEIRLILLHRPKSFFALRTWTLILLLLDTGLRIDEALGLETANVDLDGLSARVLGKGHKERLVPISHEFRKSLFRWMQKNPGRYVFGTRDSRKLTYRNTYRDIKRVCENIGVSGSHVHPHAFRHYFAVSYIRNGGDIYRLSRILGHSSISTTQLYLRSMGIEHLQEGHSKFSPLARLA